MSTRSIESTPSKETPVNHETNHATPRTGEHAAPGLQLEGLYDDLRMLAAVRLRRERVNHTLQPTALANEVYLKLAHQEKARFNDSAHVRVVASEAMRRILIDHARSKNSAKRGGSYTRQSLDTVEPESGSRDSCGLPIEALRGALCKLSQQNTRQAAVIEMRFLEGRSVRETADALGVSVSTIENDWRTARSWLRTELASVA